MRTTLDIDTHLLKLLRADAERRGVPLKEAVAGALRRGLAAAPGPARGGRYKCPTFAMGAPAAAYDLDKALRIAATVEDEEIVRKFAARK